MSYLLGIDGGEPWRTKKARARWNEHPIDDDANDYNVDYVGRLSYRHFKIIGWVLLILHMPVPLMKLGASLDASLAEMPSIPLNILELFTPPSVFFLPMAIMSQPITRRDYIKQTLINGGGALGIIFVFELVYHRHIVGAIDAFIRDRYASLALIDEAFSAINPVGFMTFNVFLDLFLCTTVMFFLNYEPKRFFMGKRLKWFRGLIILPIAYEFACPWIKVRANSGDFHTPVTLFPLLTAKPPMMFFVFCAMVVYQVTLEARFCSAGRTRSTRPSSGRTEMLAVREVLRRRLPHRRLPRPHHRRRGRLRGAWHPYRHAFEDIGHQGEPTRQQDTRQVRQRELRRVH